MDWGQQEATRAQLADRTGPCLGWRGGEGNLMTGEGGAHTCHNPPLPSLPCIVLAEIERGTEMREGGGKGEREVERQSLQKKTWEQIGLEYL